MLGGLKEKMLGSLLTDENIAEVCDDIIRQYEFHEGEKPVFLLTKEKDGNNYISVASMRYIGTNWTIEHVKESIKASELCKRVLSWKKD